MGEIAEMMLDGTLCEGCGEYIDDNDAPGYPRYCSKECAQSRGVEGDDQPSIEDVCGDLKFAIAALNNAIKELKALRQNKKAKEVIGLVKNIKIFMESLDKKTKLIRN